MSADPILVLQLQRMGDLILTFPLLLSLQKYYPEHPLWVVSEPQFFTPLMHLSPNVVYFPPNACNKLAQKNFFMAINLSGRHEASLCLAKTTAEKKIGLSRTGQDNHVFGDWSLYRFALTHNNHHNTFHWADLYKLDALPQLQHVWHSPRKASTRKRIALVIGASEAAKRPEATFWGTIARKLAQNGYLPILIGGTAEKEMGEHVERLAKLPGANLCGKLKLDEVAALLRESALCISPDTGPMHLADWVGTRVLNLSMGPVHAPETGPLSPHQWVLRARMSCIGCWQCTQAKYDCKQNFYAPQIAKLALALLNEPEKVQDLCPKGLELLQSTHDEQGLYQLITKSHSSTCRMFLDSFWRTTYLFFAGLAEKSVLRNQYEFLWRVHPAVAKHLTASLEQLLQNCSHCLQKKTILPEHIWRHSPQLIRFFAGHTHMYLQNANWERKAWQKAMERIELVLSCTSDI